MFRIFLDSKVLLKLIVYHFRDSITQFQAYEVLYTIRKEVFAKEDCGIKKGIPCFIFPI